jgi:hypothetical protein
MNELSALTRTALLIERDFFPDLQEAEILTGLGSLRVQILAGMDAASTVAGQNMIATTLVLINQLGADIALEVPEVELLSVQPPFPLGAGLPETLEEGSRGLVRPARLGRHDDPDLSIIFGTGVSHVAPRAPRCFLAAEDFSAHLHPWAAPGEIRATLPFGPILAGVLAAAESFRLAVRRIAAVYGEEPLGEHYLGPIRPARVQLPAFPLGQTELGRVDAISAGAITNAALFALLRVPSLAAEIDIYDDDMISLDNLNRCGLFTRADQGCTKVETLCSFATEDLRLRPQARRFEEGGFLAQRVIVGVDHIPSRWSVQRAARGWLGVAGTSHFAAIASEHLPGGPCAGCLHPVDDPTEGPVPTVSFVSALGGTLLAHRLLASATSLAPVDPTWAWALALFEQRGLTEIGLTGDRRCQVGCAASQRAGLAA